MKTLKGLLLILPCLVVINAFGQNTAQMNPQQRTDYINQHVADLSPEQKSKLLAIEIKYQSDAKAIGPNRIDSLRRVTDVKIEGVLSNTQFEQYKILNPYMGEGR